jgi:UDP-N-acetylmuramate dehydrogenase (EC 1.1.1.158)
MEALQASFAWAHDEGVPVTLLGAGSNLLVSDRGLSGLVVATRYLKQVNFNPETGQVTAGRGSQFPALLGWRLNGAGKVSNGQSAYRAAWEGLW